MTDEQTASTPEPKPVVRVPVRLISKARKTALVEWDDGDDLARAYVPADTIDENGTIAEDDLALGVRYGLPWEELLTFRVTPADVAREMRVRGIWTAADMPGRKAMVAIVGNIIRAALDEMSRAARKQEDQNATK